MDNTQRDAYDGATTIKSVPFDLVSRDNRNHRKKLDAILAATNATRGDWVLEVGCGHGLHAREYAKRFDYWGIDISESLVSETRRRIDAVSNSWGCMQMDARDLAFADGRFIAVVGTAILHHLPEFDQALREWLRVTEPGGSITLAEPNYLFPKDFIETHLVAAERHKRHMAPWRLRRTLRRVCADHDATYEVTPFTYTLPWPERLGPLYDRVDAVAARTPGVRWLAQMLRIHIEC